MPDYRTKASSELTFYAFSSPNNRFKIYRYDTLDEAIDKFKESLKESGDFTGIGISKNDREIDIVHKNGDSYALVTDYTRLPSMKFDREIRETVKEAVSKLAIVWEYNHNLFNNSALSSLCIPCVIGNENLLHNEMVDKLSIKPSTANNILSALEKLYISNEEKWLSTQEVMVLCKSGEHPKIESVSVKVEDKASRAVRSIDISPQDYLIMADNYLLSHVKGFPLYETNLAFDKLAGDLNDFLFDVDYYEYQDRLPTGGEAEVVENIANNLKIGNIQPFIDELASFKVEGQLEEQQLYRAVELISRLEKVLQGNDIKIDLDNKIKKAEQNSSFHSKYDKEIVEKDSRE